MVSSVVVTPPNVMGAVARSPGMLSPPVVDVTPFVVIVMPGRTPLQSLSPTEPVSSMTETGSEVPTLISMMPLCPEVPGVVIVRIGTDTVIGVLAASVGASDVASAVLVAADAAGIERDPARNATMTPLNALRVPARTTLPPASGPTARTPNLAERRHTRSAVEHRSWQVRESAPR